MILFSALLIGYDIANVNKLYMITPGKRLSLIIYRQPFVFSIFHNRMEPIHLAH